MQDLKGVTMRRNGSLPAAPGEGVSIRRNDIALVKEGVTMCRNDSLSKSKIWFNGSLLPYDKGESMARNRGETLLRYEGVTFIRYVHVKANTRNISENMDMVEQKLFDAGGNFKKGAVKNDTGAKVISLWDSDETVY